MIEDSVSTHHATENSEKILSKLPENFFMPESEFSVSSLPLSLEYLSSKAFVCVGCEDGITRVVSTTKWDMQYKLVNEDKSPVMGLAASCDTAQNIRNAIMVVHSQGTMQFWHTTSEQILFSKKYDNNLQSCEISPNGEWYAISGQNGKMMLGHLNKGEPKTLETGHLGAHGNRVFCIKWDPKDENIFYSGGWDNTVFFWDVRTKTSFNKLFGLYMGGQSIDLKNDKMLLGNNKNSNQLRVYDIKADKMRLVRWENYTEESLHTTTGVNSCFFGQDEDEVLALSSAKQIRYIRQETCLSLYSHGSQNARGYTMAKKPSEKQIITGWSNGDIKIFSY